MGASGGALRELRAVSWLKPTSRYRVEVQGLVHLVVHVGDNAFRAACGARFMLRDHGAVPPTDKALTCLGCMAGAHDKPVEFTEVSGARFRRSKFELMAYDSDITKILTDNSVKKGK